MILIYLYLARCNVLGERNKGVGRRGQKLERERRVLF